MVRARDLVGVAQRWQPRGERALPADSARGRYARIGAHRCASQLMRVTFAKMAKGVCGHMDIKGWATAHNSRVVKNAPHRSPIALALGGAIWGGLAALLIFLAVAERVGPGAVGGFAVPVVLAAALSAWLFWRATRFRIAQEATEVGGALALTASRWSVTLQPGDVRQVVQLRRNPYGSGIYNVTNPAWGAWLRIDASTGGTRVRRYLVWRADAPAFLEQLRTAGFSLVGEVASVPEPS